MQSPHVNCYAIIVAAGRGYRAGGDLPKQYRNLAEQPLIRYSAEAFLKHDSITKLIIVTHPNDQELYEHALAGLEYVDVHGGAERQDSVRNGLLKAKELGATDDDFVLIHDAARPFISKALVTRMIDSLSAYDAAIPVLDIVDTVKIFDDHIVSGSIDRDRLKIIQTPQSFKFATILEAHEKARGQILTDDASVVEATGGNVHAVIGDKDNFKLTTDDDFEKAENMIKEKQSHFSIPRMATGVDVHRFDVHCNDADHVILCGVEIPHTHKLKGHSDADVAMHALTDALLGTIAAGDIGTHFPPSDPQWKGASSDIFLKHACKLIQDKGGNIAHVDVTIICEKPKIGPHKEAMRAKLAEFLEINMESVSVKATTTEKLGFTGRSEGIAAQAAATVLL